MRKKAQVHTFIVYLMGILMIGFAISILMKPMKVTYDATYDDPDVQADEYQEFYTRSVTFWRWIPLGLVLAIITWYFVEANKNEAY
jgi:hypothetical protein